MKVETVITEDNRRRFMLVDKKGEPIQPVMKYIKFLDNNEAARNTLRNYCQDLKLFFEFLEQKELSYKNIDIDKMAEFKGFLKNPYESTNVSPVKPTKSPRNATTINRIISTVLNFYDYLLRHDYYENQLSEKLKRTIPGNRKNFKGFLEHIGKDKPITTNILKEPEARRNIDTLTKEQVEDIIKSCNNLRDKFLIYLLFETGFRISEVLSLWIEDFEPDAQKIHLKDRGELSNLAEIKTVHSPRSIDISFDLINMFSDYIAEYHTDKVDTNHVFIKLSGNKKYQPMEYEDVMSLFRRIRAKTGIQVTPHVFRHTHFDILRKQGWEPEKMKERGGWADIQTVMQIYFHPDSEELREQWEKTEGFNNLNINVDKEED